MKRVYEEYNGKMHDVSGFWAKIPNDIRTWENGQIGEYFYQDAMAYQFNYKDGTYCLYDGMEYGTSPNTSECVFLVTKRQAEDFEEFWDGEGGKIYKTENMEDGKLYLCEEHFDCNDKRPNRAWIVKDGKDITDYLNGKTDNLVEADVLNV